MCRRSEAPSPTLLRRRPAAGSTHAASTPSIAAQLSGRSASRSRVTSRPPACCLMDTMRMSEQPILKVNNLKKSFAIRTGIFAYTPLWAVDNVSFEVLKGETLGLVGESGSGKTTVGMCLLRLEEPDGGQILFEGVDLLQMKGRQLRQARRHLQMVFQDPLDSLNPRMTAGEIAAEPLLLHGLATNQAAARRQVIDLFGIVGLQPEHLDRYPHQLSGGQRQRVGIARALATRPQLIVLDEPTSALDVSVQATLLNLLTDLQQRFGLSYVFISHDLAVISQQATRVAVMYLGQIVESGPTEAIFANPRHQIGR